MAPADREIWRLALPALGALVAQPLFVMIDAAIVGTLGTEPLAGLGAASTVATTVVGLCIFLAYATTSDVARLVGSGDKRAALSQGIDGMGLGILLGIPLGVALWFSAEPLSRALGTSDAVTPYSVAYLQVISWALPALLGVLAGVGVLRGLQDTRATLLVTLAQVALNLALCLLFVLILGWGITGSAAATGLAELLGLLAYGWLVLRRAQRAGVRLAPSGAGVMKAARDGVPLFVRTVALRIVFVLAVAVAARLGDAELASYHVTATLFFTLALALDALAIAGQALIGRTLGADDVSSTRDVTNRLVRWSLILGVVLAVVVLVLRPWLPHWFSSDPSVLDLIASALLVLALLQPLAGIVFALDGILIGAGDTRWLAVAQLVMMLAFLPAAWWVLTVQGSLASLWWALGWFLLVRGALLGWRARGSAWMVTGAVR